MQGHGYKTLVGMMWLALPLSASEYGRAWDRLPARMAVHFDARWQPNGYTSREGALELGLGILLGVLVSFTLATLVLHACKPAAAWPALLLGYAVLGLCWYGNVSIVNFNLKAQAPGSIQSSVFSHRSSDSSANGFAGESGGLSTEY